VYRATPGRGDARPGYIAPAVLFLASDDARYITGTFPAASTGQAHV
jgi:NAD(P)-dependent dehydrogenase (short-subunit alcohol dehydrogenase family)